MTMQNPETEPAYIPEPPPEPSPEPEQRKRQRRPRGMRFDLVEHPAGLEGEQGFSFAEAAKTTAIPINQRLERLEDSQRKQSDIRDGLGGCQSLSQAIGADIDDLSDAARRELSRLAAQDRRDKAAITEQWGGQEGGFTPQITQGRQRGRQGRRGQAAAAEPSRTR